jgi:hypothetical protein
MYGVLQGGFIENSRKRLSEDLVGIQEVVWDEVGTES